MNEAQRQSYLRALGLTPWVARVPLPGAAPSEALDWEAETDHRPTPMADAVPATSVPRPADNRREEPSARVEQPSAPTEQPSARTEEPSAGIEEPSAPVETPARTDAPPAPARSQSTGQNQALVFTLEVHLAGDTWVAFEQEDAQAPELGRHTGVLAASLLAVYGATPERPRRFYCPLAGQPTTAAEAGQALRAFLDGLAGRYGGQRVLFCVGEALSRALFDAGRYEGFRLGDRPALAVSSLQEMLADPVRHKSASWRAMRSEGFGGARV